MKRFIELDLAGKRGGDDARNSKMQVSQEQKSEQRQQSSRRFNGKALVWQTVGWILMIGGIPLLFLAADLLPDRANGEAGDKLLLYIYFGFLLPFGMLCFRVGKRYKAHSAAQVLADDLRPPVLYLRPFHSDKTATRVRAWKHFGSFGVSSDTAWESNEEQIADVMNEIGPFVAIGRPGERVAQLGAARLYTNDSEWQLRVTELLSKAELVLLRVGVSSGIAWEVEGVTRVVSPERIVLLVGKHKGEYLQFCTKFSRYFRQGLPDPSDLTWSWWHSKDLGALIYFEENWSPHVSVLEVGGIKVRGGRRLEAGLMNAMNPVRKQLGLPYRKWNF